ncbi:YqaJ viral recombinase family protein [Pseudarthrobacter sp. NIBRBAC000502770]|uniref:YqaJ viral recombinase family protein n=1 Tax=Pseudarthrobacter sp. NIBRBAC000502770 TaxID=2590785 RepID=UPI00113FCDBB|nr:YqaJ viral recombinase family protein [Pseudarthrobacter sp. NIBRBAC000502770]QDG87151.1 YqaJ viral recombinase family protein [Pseudarthrobacter sp. NIBRBAC000502770]
MTLHLFKDLEQGTDEWLAARCGIVTASVVGQLVTSRQPSAIETDCPDCGAAAADPCTGKRSPGPLKTLHSARAAAAREMDRVITADNSSETARGLTMTLAAERITGHVDPVPTSRAMERGTMDEPYARDAYSEHHAPVTELGFMVRQFDGFKIGYSPDGLVGEDGLIEIKSRAQKAQLKTVLADEVPAENMAQLQTGLLVSGRAWIDYTSYCGGMRLWTKRVYPDPAWQTAIIDAVEQFEKTASEMVSTYLEVTDGLPETERIDHYLELELKL